MAAGQATRIGAGRAQPGVGRPGWVTAVGIIAILVGGAGVFGAYLTAMTPMIMEAQDRFLEEAMEEARHQVAGEPEGEPLPTPEEVREAVDSFMDFPDWYGRWSYVSAGLKVLASGFLVWAAILLLLMRPRSLGIFYLALGLSSAVVLVNFLAASLTGSVVLLAGAAAGFVVLAVNLILLLVTLFSDRGAFRAAAAGPRV